MPKTLYQGHSFSKESRDLIEVVNVVIEEYREQGYDLTLRQLYYQFVSRALIENTQKSYKRLGDLVNNGRLAGLIDWTAIVDRTRNLMRVSTRANPAEIIRACSHSFAVDKWATQAFRLEVWIEKDALAGVFSRVCDERQIPYFACRGFVSQSEMWAAAERFKGYAQHGQGVHVIHFGDHDPSGLDMSRDIRSRLKMFQCEVEFKRLALNIGQIEEHKPPPNPAKTTDSRYADYADEFGDESWELDALDPATLSAFVVDYFNRHHNIDAWLAAEVTERKGRALLGELARSWELVSEQLRQR